MRVAEIPDPLLDPTVLKVTGELHEKAKVGSGQRKINIIWEVTQAIIALSVTGQTLYVAGRIATNTQDTSSFLLLSNAFFLVIGFYFGRTNHARPAPGAPMLLRD